MVVAIKEEEEAFVYLAALQGVLGRSGWLVQWDIPEHANHVK
jgi:hypothetical protein